MQPLKEWYCKALYSILFVALTSTVSVAQFNTPVSKWGTYVGGEDVEFSTDGSRNHKVVVARPPYADPYWTDRDIIVIGTTNSKAGIATIGDTTYPDSGEVGFLASYSRDGRRKWSRYLNFIPEDIAVSPGGGQIAVIGTSMSSDTLSNRLAVLTEPTGAQRTMIQVFYGNGQLEWESYFHPDTDSGLTVKTSRGNAIHIDSNEFITFAGVYDVGDRRGRGYLSTLYLNEWVGDTIPKRSISRQPAALLETEGDLLISDLICEGSGVESTMCVVVVGATTDTLTWSYSDSYGSLFGGVSMVHQRTCNGSSSQASYDGFVWSQRLNFPNGFKAGWGRKMVPGWGWLSYFGGKENDVITAVDAAVSNDATSEYFISGVTSSLTNIASAGSHLPYPLGRKNGFLASFQQTGKRNWGTYIGGVEETTASSVSACFNGNVAVGGTTSCDSDVSTEGSDFFKGGSTDGYVAIYSRTGEQLWSRYVGGFGNDTLTSVAMPQDFLVCNGTTTSLNGIATPGAYRPRLLGKQQDAFISAFNASCMPESVSIRVRDSVCTGDWSGVVYCLGGELFIARNSSRGSLAVESRSQGLSYRRINDSTLALISLEYGQQSALLWVEIDGCFQKFDIKVNVKEPKARIVQDGNLLKIVVDDSDDSGNITYRWNRNGAQIPGAANSTFRANLPGEYSCTVIFGPNCVATLGPVDIGTSSAPDPAFRVYPNPSDGSINIQLDSPLECESLVLRIVNVLGQVIDTIPLTSQRQRINLRNVAPPGNYVMLFSGCNELTERAVPIIIE